MLNKTLFLEIDKPNYTPIYSVQYDYNSRFYNITILNQSQPLDLTGLRVVVAGKKPDGEDVFNSCKILDAKKGQVQLELTEQMNAVNGASEYALELFSADGMLSSQPFKLIVTRSTIPKSVESSKELGALKDALNEVQDIDNRFAQTNAQLSTKASEQALAIERARIDSFTKLNEGSTTGDAELIDARVGADGVVYPNLGDSIRTQINDSNNRTKQVSDLGTVGLNVEMSERVGFLMHNGSYSSDPSLHCKTTSKIYCFEGWVFSYKGRGSALSASWIFYSGDRLVDYGQHQGETQVEIPEGVDNIVFSSYNGLDDDVVLEVELIKPQFLNANNLINNLAKKIKVSELHDDVRKAILYEEYAIDKLDMVRIGDKYASRSGNVIDATGHACYEIAVKPGEMYSYSGSVIWDLAPYHLVDASGKTVVVGGDSQSHDTATPFSIDELVIPNNVVKLRVCSGNSGGETNFALFKKDITTPISERTTKNIVENHVYDDLGNYTDITDGFEIITGYYISNNGGLVSDGNSQHTELIDITKLSVIYIDAHSQYSTCTMAIYDSAKKNLGAKGYAGEEGETFWDKHRVVISDLLEEYPNAHYIRLGTYQYKTNPLKVYERKASIKQIVDSLETRLDIANQGSNVLHGKKYVACGDSFTEGDFTGYVDEDGLSGKNSPKLYDKNRKMYKTYPWWIAERNNMELINEAKCGSVITNAFDGQRNPFSINRYLQVPTDADYITLMFGLNETGLTTEQIGTNSDTTNTTLWGAYNIVFEHFLTNMPYAKIGVIIADAWMNTKYANAVKEICAYWGIPVLDLKFDPNVTMGIGGRPNGSPKAQQLRDLAFKVTSSNAHPNVEAHEYRSTTIEHFLRSL